MERYKHIVQYYETDKMGVTHHSNYIRWMEEARVDFFKQIGFDYLEFEKMGIMSPVVALNNVKFKKPSTVGDTVEIEVSVDSYNSIVISIHYKMYKDDTLIFEGNSEHCFINTDGKIMKLSDNVFPEFNKKLIELANQNK